MPQHDRVVALVDGRVIDHPTAGGRGVGRYTVGFVRSMVESGIETLVLCASEDQSVAWRAEVVGVTTAPLRRATIDAISPDRHRWFICTQLMLHPVPLDVIPALVTESGIAVAAIVHDVIPQRHPERYLADPFAAVQARLRTVTARSVDVLLANSTFTADTTAVELGIERERIHVVGAAVEPHFTPGHVDLAGLKRLGVHSSPPVVAVTGADSRKNTERLIRSWARVPDEVRAGRQLVVACAAPQSVIGQWRHLAHVEGIGHEVVITGAVSDDELVNLYRHAEFSILPSIEEGFGLPIAESVACGTPALCSVTSSMPEVCGSEDALFDPFDICDMARVMTVALADPALRSDLLVAEQRRLERWTTRNVGSAIADALSAPAPQRIAPRARRTRIAIAAPPPHSPSGIGAYTDMVLAAWPDDDELLRLDDVACTDSRHRAVVDGVAAVGVGSIDRRIRAHDVDQVVMVLGSSEFHAVTADRARSGGSHVWLHEATLLGAHLGPALRGGGLRWFEHRMDDLSVVVPSDVDDAETLHTAGVDALAPVVTKAASVIVSSVDAVPSVIAACGAQPVPPILVLPLAHPERAATEPTTSRRVVALGWASDPSMMRRLLAAIDELDDVTLDIVGGADAQVRGIVESMSQSGLRDRVTLHGRVDDATLDALLSSATVGVRLGSAHVGQMSASITELIARGIPVVTDLTTHGPSFDAMTVLPSGWTVGELGSAIRELSDPSAWRRRSEAARERAASWGVEAVAHQVRSWLRRSDELAPGTVEVVAA